MRLLGDEAAQTPLHLFDEDTRLAMARVQGVIAVVGGNPVGPHEEGT